MLRFSDFDKTPKDVGEANDIVDARPLLILGDHVRAQDIARPGPMDDQALMRRAFTSSNLYNEMLPWPQAGMTCHMPDGRVMSIFDAALRYRDGGLPMIVIAGKAYGTGIGSDVAAKSQRLLGVEAVIAESFDYHHRADLVRMGILPLQFPQATTRRTLGLNGKEIFDLVGFIEGMTPGMPVTCELRRPDGGRETVVLHCCIESTMEVNAYRNCLF